MGLRVSIEHADGNLDLVSVNHGDIIGIERRTRNLGSGFLAHADDTNRRGIGDASTRADPGLQVCFQAGKAAGIKAG